MSEPAVARDATRSQRMPVRGRLSVVPTQRPARSQPTPCAARPNTGFFHPEGKCECFYGGTPPMFEAAKGSRHWPGYTA